MSSKIEGVSDDVYAELFERSAKKIGYQMGPEFKNDFQSQLKAYVKGGQAIEKFVFTPTAGVERNTTDDTQAVGKTEQELIFESIGFAKTVIGDLFSVVEENMTTDQTFKSKRLAVLSLMKTLGKLEVQNLMIEAMKWPFFDGSQRSINAVSPKMKRVDKYKDLGPRSSRLRELGRHITYMANYTNNPRLNAIVTVFAVQLRPVAMRMFDLPKSRQYVSNWVVANGKSLFKTALETFKMGYEDKMLEFDTGVYGETSMLKAAGIVALSIVQEIVSNGKFNYGNTTTVAYAALQMVNQDPDNKDEAQAYVRGCADVVSLFICLMLAKDGKISPGTPVHTRFIDYFKGFLDGWPKDGWTADDMVNAVRTKDKVFIGVHDTIKQKIISYNPIGSGSGTGYWNLRIKR